MKTYKRIFIFLATFYAVFFHNEHLFAANANQKGNPTAHEPENAQIRSDSRENSSDMFSNSGNPVQMAHFRELKSNHFVKFFFIELLGFVILLCFSKKILKRNFGRHSYFIKLLLFPDHAFW